MEGTIESIIFPPDSNPYGISYSDWTVRWWRWLLSIPKETNPVFDTTGLYSAQMQEDPNVCFLAGTLGGSAERTCEVPVGKAILVPIINYECSFADEPLFTTDSELESKCKSEIDDIKDVIVKINRLSLKELVRYRVQSPLFKIDLINNNALGAPSGSTKMISDGFWIMLKPLGIGKHQVSLSGSCRSGRIKIGSTYTIHVRARKE